MTGIKVLFMDIDGVLNCRATFDKAVGPEGMETYGVPPSVVDPELIRKVNIVTYVTGAKIVISSTWRLYQRLQDLRDFLRSKGLTGDVICSTPNLPTIGRTSEILTWLKSTGRQVNKYVIVDDDPIDDPNFVQTSFRTGITDETVTKLIALLT